MRNSEALQQKFDQVAKTGEIPYQANRRALKVVDILNDGENGLHEVDIILRGLDMLEADIIGLRNEAKSIGNRAIAQLRSS